MRVLRFGTARTTIVLALAATAPACARGAIVLPGQALGDDADGVTPVDDAGSTTPPSGDDSGDYSGDSGAVTASSSSSGGSDVGTGTDEDSGGSSSGSSSSSSSGSAPDDAGSPPPATGLSVSYQVQDSSPMSAYIGCEISVNDASSTPVQLSGLTVRYYYTDEVHMTPTMTLNWSHISTSGADQSVTVTSTFGTVTPAATGADSYVEFSFSGGLSTLSSGQAIVFSWQMQASNPAQDIYTQTNDYSFDATKTTLTAWNNIVLFQSGSVAWGVVP
jgi:cold shock CspA family protein